jgi:hypothetical protein
MAAIPVGLAEYNPATGTKKVFSLYANGSGEDTQQANFCPTRAYNPISANVGGTEYQVAGFYDDPDEYLIIGVRSKTAGTWSSWTTYRYDGTGGRPTLQRSSVDNHRTIAFGVDSDGYIHLAWGMHGDALRYRRSSAALGSWTGGLTANLSMLGTNESVATYPYFINDPTGKLWFMFRDGSSGNGDSFLYGYTTGTTTWAGAAGTTAGKFIDGKNSGGGESAYLFKPAFSTDWDGAGTGFLYIAFVWDETGMTAARHDVSIVKFDGTNWKAMSGSAQTMPITTSNDDVIDPVATNLELRGMEPLILDSNNRPHLVYKLFLSSTTTVDGLYHNYWNGSAWTKTRLDWGHNNDYDFAAHDICIDGDDQIYCVTTNKTQGNGIYCFTSPGTDWGKTWKLTELTDQDVRIGADGVSTRAMIQIDPYQWRVNGVMQFLVPLAGDSGGANTAFPDGWDYADKATITNPASDTDNPWFVIDASRLSARFWAEVQSDLDDVRLSDGQGNMLPCYVHVYNYGATTGMIFGRWVGPLDSAATQEVRVHYGNATATTPAVTHILGRNNCWRERLLGMYIDGDGTDYSRAGNTLTATGSPTGGGQAGPFGTLKSTDFNGTTQYYSLTPATISAAPASAAIIAWTNSDSGIATQTVAGLTDTADTDRYHIGQLRGATGGTPASAISNANGAALVAGDSASGYTASTWQQVAFRFPSTASRSAVINGTSGTPETSTRAADNLDCISIGVLRRTTTANFFDGKISLVQVYDAACPSVDEIAHQRAMSDQATFWGTWADVTDGTLKIPAGMSGGFDRYMSGGFNG